MMLYESYYGIADLGSGLLYHHGIKGQKWGIRRFQNPDGSWTSAGKQRYFTSDGKLTKSGEKLYRRENKKLSKLKDHANTDLQRKRAEKYDKVANVAKKVGLTAGAIAVGSKLVDYGLESARPGIVSNFKARIKQNDARAGIITNAMHAKTGQLLRKHWAQLDAIELQPDTRAKRAAWDATFKRFETQHHNTVSKAKTAVSQLNSNSELLRKTAKALGKVQQGARLATAVSTGVAAGAGATYVYSKIQAHVARKRLTDLGHEKALSDVMAQTDRIKRMFGDVKLEDISFEEKDKGRKQR